MAVAGLVSGVAFAQSNVTIYGRMDAGFASVKSNSNGQMRSTGVYTGGLTTPREPCELVHGRVLCKSGLDVTEAFERGAAMTVHLARLYGCTQAILKSRSPSCGCGRIHDGTFSGILIQGNGLTATALLQAGIAVQTEDDL